MTKKPFFVVVKDNIKKEFLINGPTLDDEYETRIAKNGITCSTSFEIKEVIIKDMIERGYKLVSRLNI